MQKAMLAKVRGLSEALVADLALVGPFSGVGYVVPGQVSLGNKCLATFGTLKRPLPRMRPQVITHVHQLLELLATRGTFVLALQHMHDSLMPYHPDMGGERLSTLRAQEPTTGGLGRVPWGKQGRGGAIPKCFPLAGHWLRRLAGCRVSSGPCGWDPTLARVCASMVKKLGHIAESLAAVTTVQGVGSVIFAVHN